MKIVGCGALGPGERRVPIDRYSLDMSGAENPQVLYVATPKATPDTFQKAVAGAKQYYESLGIGFHALSESFDQRPTRTEIEHKLGEAALINVSGGDTLRAVDLFKQWGILKHMRQAVKDGVVWTGTSAGAIMPFEFGHSDSLSYRADDGEPWDYIWVEGLEFSPGVICPHYNTATEGGEMRRSSIARMIQQRDTPFTSPIYGIDNRAALVIDGSRTSSISVESGHEVHLIDPISGEAFDQLPRIP